MSQENVEAVLRGCDAFNHGDDQAFAALADPDLQWDTGLLGTPTYRGPEGIRQMLRDVRASWTDMRGDLVGAPLDLGGWVVWEFRLRAEGRTTGAPVEMSQFIAAEFRDGLVIRGGAFASKTEALEAAGLSEQDAHADS
jgi:ketosteroid isomerase-like protein